MGAHRERSRCPIAYSLDVVGDRRTLVVRGVEALSPAG
jgi:hypothetical protein